MATEQNVKANNVDAQATAMMKHFGGNIKYFRKKKSIKQKDLAATLGVSATHVALVEKGLRNPSIEMMLKMCLLLDEGIAEMFVQRQPATKNTSKKRIKPLTNHTWRGLRVDEGETAGMDEIMENFGKNLREARKKKSLNLSEIANYVNISISRLRLVEKGEMPITFEEAINICDFLGEDIVEMLMPQCTSTLVSELATEKTARQLQEEMAYEMLTLIDDADFDDIFKKLKGCEPKFSN